MKMEIKRTKAYVIFTYKYDEVAVYDKVSGKWKFNTFRHFSAEDLNFMLNTVAKDGVATNENNKEK